MATRFGQKRSLRLRPSVKHFSHCHFLRPFEAKEEDEIICSGCGLDLLNSSAYECVKSDCDFLLHKSCFELPRELQHKFHPEHPLTLLSSPPYSIGRFSCDACGDYGTAFTYHCSTCNGTVPESCWVYCCPDCDYGTDIGCATAEAAEEEEEEEEEGEQEEAAEEEDGEQKESLSSEYESLLAAQKQLRMLQLQSEMSFQTARMISNMGRNLADLIH